MSQGIERLLETTRSITLHAIEVKLTSLYFIKAFVHVPHASMCRRLLQSYKDPILTRMNVMLSIHMHLPVTSTQSNMLLF